LCSPVVATCRTTSSSVVSDATTTPSPCDAVLSGPRAKPPGH
jgi:hypothetical protein